MKLFKNKEEFHKALIVFVLIASSALFIFGIYKLGDIWQAVKKILGFFTPFYIGFAIAYLLAPALRFIETKLLNKTKKRAHRRALAITILYILFAGVLFLLLYFILPGLFSSISSLISIIPSGAKNLVQAIERIFERYPQINDFYADYGDNLTNLLTQNIQSLANGITSLLPSVLNMTVSITETVAKIFIGIVISIYMLLSKEKLIAQSKKFLYAIANEQVAQKIIQIGHISHKKMSSYLVGQISISLIDAVIIYIVSNILKFPYPLLLATISALFNMIPFFGAIIGCIPCLLIILIQSPIKALYFLIFFIILQQIEGNVFGPKIQAKQLNISPIWVIFAILLFGGLFGFWGLLIGVPLFSVLLILLSQLINEGLRQKGMSTDTEDYLPYSEQ